MAATVDWHENSGGNAPVQETTVTVVTRTVTPPPSYNRVEEKDPSWTTERVSTRDRRLSIETGDATDLTNPPTDTSSMSQQTRAPDGGYGWVVVFAVFMIHVILDGVTFSFGMLFPPILEEFNATKSTASWVVSMLMGTTFFCGNVSTTE